MVADDEPIGESWEVSAVPSCASIVTNVFLRDVRSMSEPRRIPTNNISQRMRSW